jgi:hypothetical protein
VAAAQPLSLPVLATLALFAGSPGMVKHAHDMFTDVALVAGGAMATYGLLLIALNEERNTPSWKAAFWFGLGVGITLMSKGLFVPLTFAATALAVGILVPACRRRSYWKMVGAAVLVSLPFFVIWPALLAQHSMPLFMEWFWDNNVGRFFGFSVQKLGSDNDHTVILRALAGFALPVSLLALLALSSGDWRQAVPRAWPCRWPSAPSAWPCCKARPPRASSTCCRSCCRWPCWARALPRLPQRLHLVWDWLSRLLFGTLAVGIWAIYLVSTSPADQHRAASWANGCRWTSSPPSSPGLAGGRRHERAVDRLAGPARSRGPVARRLSWFGGMTLMWGLAFTLLMPWADYGKSYEYVYTDLKARIAPLWQEGDCMASQALGESEAPMLFYYTGILHQPMAGTPHPLPLADPGNPKPPGVRTATGSCSGRRRDGDQGQLFKVYQRAPEDALPIHQEHPCRPGPAFLPFAPETSLQDACTVDFLRHLRCTGKPFSTVALSIRAGMPTWVICRCSPACRPFAVLL